jgi:hypothetical protein
MNIDERSWPAKLGVQCNEAHERSETGTTRGLSGVLSSAPSCRLYRAAVISHTTAGASDSGLVGFGTARQVLSDSDASLGRMGTDERPRYRSVEVAATVLEQLREPAGEIFSWRVRSDGPLVHPNSASSMRSPWHRRASTLAHVRNFGCCLRCARQANAGRWRLGACWKGHSKVNRPSRDR